jgi:hypothetical protein
MVDFTHDSFVTHVLYADDLGFNVSSFSPAFMGVCEEFRYLMGIGLCCRSSSSYRDLNAYGLNDDILLDFGFCGFEPSSWLQAAG